MGVCKSNRKIIHTDFDCLVKGSLESIKSAINGDDHRVSIVISVGACSKSLVTTFERGEQMIIGIKLSRGKSCTFNLSHN